MDIFFMVTTVVVVVWGFVGTLLLIVLFRVLRHIERLSKTVADGAEDIRDDMDDLRTSVREEGVRMKHIFEFFTGAMAGSSPRATSSSAKTSGSANSVKRKTRTIKHDKE